MSLAALESFPEVRWRHGDDLCDCTFQRIGEWTNPYLGKTLIIRMCCIWDELLKDHPQFVQEVDGYWDENLQEFVPMAFDWNGEHDMPRALWYRQLSIRENKALDAIRDEYRLKEPPKGAPVERSTNGHVTGLRRWYGSID